MTWWLIAIVIWIVVSFGAVALVISTTQVGRLTNRRSRNALPVFSDHDPA